LRELREETGLEVAELQPLGEFVYVRESWEEEPGLRVHVEAYLVDVDPGWEPVLNEEHDEYRWLPPDEAAELFYWPEPAALLRSL
jgi:8-oxo-dGTP pyrophosphatase MutT (NUDIX family)